MVSSFLLSSVDASFFHTEPARQAYQRLVTVAEKRSRILDYQDLVEDPSLDEDVRDVLREQRKKSVKNQQDAEELIEQLDRYRKLRVAYDSARTTIDKLKEPKVDPDELLDFMAGKLGEARSRENLQDKIHSVGKDANALDLVDKALSPESVNLLKTGFEDFDTKNGGLPQDGVFLLSATTSGGKSVMRMNLCKNMYEMNNIDVLTVSLEMSEVKETRRLLANLTGIEFWKFVKNALTQEERDQARAAWKKFHKHGKKNDCRYSVFCPTRGLNIQQLLTLIKPYKYKVVAIDYVSLLDGVDAQDQWKALSSIVRQCKIFASENNCLVIILAQLDGDDDRIRYAKGMLEHADACWIWNYSKPEQRELRELPIKQLKARDQELFPFFLKEEYHIMRVSNMSGETAVSDDRRNDEEEDAPRNSKKSKSKNKDKGGDREKPRKRDRDRDVGTGEDEEVKFDVD